MEEKGLIKRNSPTQSGLTLTGPVADRFVTTRGLTLADSFNGNFRELTLHKDSNEQMLAVMSAQLIQCIQFRGGEITANHAVDVAVLIINNYPTMSPEAFAMFIESIKTGFVQSCYKKYDYPKIFGKINPGIIMDCMKDFQEAMTDEFERKVEEERKKWKTEPEAIKVEKVLECYKNWNWRDQETKMIGASDEFEAILNRHTICELEYMHRNSPNTRMREKIMDFWKKTEPVDQVSVWFPILYHNSSVPDTEYMFGGDRKTAMFKYAAGVIAKDHPEDFKKITQEAIDGWIKSLKEAGHTPVGSTYEEIKSSLTPDLPVPDFTYFRRLGIVLFYYTNYIGEKA